MVKYKVGDKVVIRKDLVDGRYGGIYWIKKKEYMKELDYVVIKKVDTNGDYVVDNWFISDEMIEGLYEESSIIEDYVNEFLGSSKMVSEALLMYMSQFEEKINTKDDGKKDNRTYPELVKNEKGTYIYTSSECKYKIPPETMEVDVSDECLRLRCYGENNELIIREIDTTNMKVSKKAILIKYLSNELEDLVINFEIGLKSLAVKDEYNLLKK